MSRALAWGRRRLSGGCSGAFEGHCDRLRKPSEVGLGLDSCGEGKHEERRGPPHSSLRIPTRPKTRNKTFGSHAAQNGLRTLLFPPRISVEITNAL